MEAEHARVHHEGDGRAVKRGVKVFENTEIPIEILRKSRGDPCEKRRKDPSRYSQRDPFVGI